MQKLRRGRGSMDKLPALMKELKITCPMIVGRAQVEKLGMPDAPVFSDYHPNPDWADCAFGAALFREKGCDGLISLGGGSAMDTAKGVKALLMAQTPEQALSGDLAGEGVPHIAIPTSAGTGSEATPFAVVYVDGTKHSLSHQALTPDAAVLDANLLDSLPLYHKKSCALDALSQGIESYWAKGATEDSRVAAYLAIRGVLDNLRAYVAGDAHAAEEMLEAAYRSGKAIAVTRTTAAHALSYGLTKRLGIAHGHACALTLPFLWAEMSTHEEMLPVLMELAGVMRLGSDLMGPKLLQGILLDLDMTAPKLDDPAVLDELAEKVNVQRLSNHPVALSEQTIRRIYRQAFAPMSDMERQACLDIWRYY